MYIVHTCNAIWNLLLQLELWIHYLSLMTSETISILYYFSDRYEDLCMEIFRNEKVNQFDIFIFKFSKIPVTNQVWKQNIAQCKNFPVKT